MSRIAPSAVRVTVLTAALIAATGPTLIAQSDERAAKSSAPKSAKTAEAVDFLTALCKRVGSNDPRIRFAAREALVVMGTRGAAALKAHKASERDPHVKAFIDRTLKRISRMRGKKGARYFGGRDIDRIAMSSNLTLEQIGQLLPVLAKHDKDVKSLWAEFKESGGFRDPEAYKDVMEEIKLLAKEAEPALAKFLDDKQRQKLRKVMERSSPFAGGGASFVLGAEGGGAVLRVAPAGGIVGSNKPKK